MTWRVRVMAMLIAIMAVPARSAETVLRPWDESRLPPFALDALSGGRVDLHQFRGRIVLVHFFATWCEPCRAEMAALQRLVDRMRDRPVTVLAIDVGEVEDRVSRFFETQRVDFPILLDRDQATTKRWQVYALPSTFMLDAELVPRFVAEGDFDWDRPEVNDVVTKLLALKAAVHNNASTTTF